MKIFESWIVLITKDCRGLSRIFFCVSFPKHRATSLNNLQFILISRVDLFLYSREDSSAAVAAAIIHPKHTSLVHRSFSHTILRTMKLLWWSSAFRAIHHYSSALWHFMSFPLKLKKLFNREIIVEEKLKSCRWKAQEKF
jgi:hypothetical protein